MKNENLIGRYVKSLLERKYFSIDAQEPLKILSQEGNYCTIEKFGSLCNPKDTSNWELMPEGWTPEQTYLSVNDLVKYEYYYTTENFSPNFWMLFRFKDVQIVDLNTINYTCLISSQKDFIQNDWCSLNFRITRKATAEEIQWLELCSRENKFIPKDQIANYSPITTKKEEIMEEYKVGGWVKSLVDYGVFIKKNQFYQIEYKILYNSILNIYIKGAPEGIKILWGHQCEWIGMNKPEIPSINTTNMEQPKFEVGKWYSYPNWFTTLYAKCSKFEDNKFWYNERILKTGNHLFETNWSNSDNQEWNKFKLITNLEEIQSFLPEGHVDKIQEQSKDITLLEQAKKLYPVGTKFISPFNDAEFTVTKDNHFYTKGDSGHIITVSTDKGNGSILPNGASVWSEKSGWGEIIKQEETISEYYECVKPEDWKNTIQMNRGNKIFYKDFITWVNTTVKEENKKQPGHFIPSTREAYDKQQNPVKITGDGFYNQIKKSNWQPYTVGIDPIHSYPLTPEKCFNNDIIEIGDEVVYKSSNPNSYNLTKKVVGFHSNGDLKLEGREKQHCDPKSYTLIKKANTQTTTINKKLDISSAIQVGNDITNIMIPKSVSVLLKNTDYEVKIKINQTQTIKI